jgi:hypothetical protein
VSEELYTESSPPAIGLRFYLQMFTASLAGVGGMLLLLWYTSR